MSCWTVMRGFEETIAHRGYTGVGSRGVVVTKVITDLKGVVVWWFVHPVDPALPSTWHDAATNEWKPTHAGTGVDGFQYQIMHGKDLTQKPNITLVWLRDTGMVGWDALGPQGASNAGTFAR